MISLTSDAFEHGQPIPEKYTGEGKDVSPPLSWSGFPENTREFALICEDPDAPQDEPWVHWLVYGIPGTRNGMPEGTAGGAFEGRNSWGRPGYNGPLPPSGHGVHHYRFKLYALDRITGLSLSATKDDLTQAMEGHILDEGELVGTYER